VFWTEEDCVFRLAIELEREFPEQVHLELPVARENFKDFDAATDKRQFVDLVVSDMRSFESDGRPGMLRSGLRPVATKSSSRPSTSRAAAWAHGSSTTSERSRTCSRMRIDSLGTWSADTAPWPRFLSSMTTTSSRTIAATTPGRRLSRCSAQARASWPLEPRPAAAEVGPAVRPRSRLVLTLEQPGAMSCLSRPARVVRRQGARSSSRRALLPGRYRAPPIGLTERIGRSTDTRWESR
jgi:hypothetical protein